MLLNYRVGGGQPNLGENGDTTSTRSQDGGHTWYRSGGGILHIEVEEGEGDYYTTSWLLGPG